MRLKRIDALLFLFPAMVIYGVFVVFPLVMGICYSFTDVSGYTRELHFTGLNNFIKIFKDARFWNSFQNTIIFTLLFAAIGNFIALLAALMLEFNWGHFYKRTIRVLFYIPSVITPIIVGYIWYYIYKVGLPGVFKALGLPALAKFEFIGTGMALYSTVAVTIWMQMGTAMIIYIAGLSTISADYYEAAGIDGAGKLWIFTRISIPMIAPAFMINIVLSLINGFKQFDQIFTMTRGGPGNRTETISLLIFNKGYEANDLPYASAVAMVLFMVVMMISILIIRRFQRREGEL